MESSLEKFNDNVLKKILNFIKSNLNSDTLVMSEEFIGICDDFSKFSGMGEHFEPEDYSFLLKLLQLNEDVLSSDEPLNRPELHKFSFDWDVWVRRYLRETYKHTMSSYDENGEDVFELMDVLRKEGAVDALDGEYIEDESIDSDYDDDSFDRTSLTKIK